MHKFYNTNRQKLLKFVSFQNNQNVFVQFYNLKNILKPFFFHFPFIRVSFCLPFQSCFLYAFLQLSKFGRSIQLFVASVRREESNFNIESSRCESCKSFSSSATIFWRKKENCLALFGLISHMSVMYILSILVPL